MHKRLTILGSGPSGLTAAIYASRAGLAPLVLHGTQAGGQLMTTTMVENFPGFKDGIMGPALMDDMQAQALRFGTEFLTADAESIDLSRRPFVIKAGGQTIETDALIIACGASPKLLGLPSEAKLMGRGVSVCATCDGFFYKGKKVFVVGGGDSALEEAMTLTKFASSVTVIHRRDQFRASKIMIDRARTTAGLDFLFDSVVDDITGTEAGGVTAITVRNVKTDAVQTLSADGIFIAIGHTPNTSLFTDQLEMNERGYLKSSGARTGVEGVFVAGEVHDDRYRQAIVAAGEGCVAALEAQWYLESHAKQPSRMSEAEATALMERFHKHLNIQGWHIVHVVPHGDSWMLIVRVGDDETFKLIPDTFEGFPVDKGIEDDDGTREKAAENAAKQEAEAESKPKDETPHATVVVDEANFDSRVLQSAVPVVVDFWATWCGPCMAIAPKIEEMAREYEGRLVIAKWEVAKDGSKIWERFNVRGIPQLILYKDGKEVKRLTGQEPKELLRHEFDALLKEPSIDSPTARALREELDAFMAAAMVRLEKAQEQCWQDLLAKVPADLARRLEEADAVIEAEIDRRLAELKSRFEKGEVGEDEYYDARFACRDQIEADPAFAAIVKEAEEAQEAYSNARGPFIPEYKAAIARCEEVYNSEVSRARSNYKEALAELCSHDSVRIEEPAQPAAPSETTDSPQSNAAPGWFDSLVNFLRTMRDRLFGKH